MDLVLCGKLQLWNCILINLITLKALDDEVNLALREMLQIYRIVQFISI